MPLHKPDFATPDGGRRHGCLLRLPTARRRWHQVTGTLTADCAVPQAWAAATYSLPPDHCGWFLKSTAERVLIAATHFNMAVVPLAWGPPLLRLARRGALHPTHATPPSWRPSMRLHACPTQSVWLAHYSCPPASTASLLPATCCCAVRQQGTLPTCCTRLPAVACVLRYSQDKTPLALFDSAPGASPWQ